MNIQITYGAMLHCVHLEVTAGAFQVVQTAKEAEIEAE